MKSEANFQILECTLRDGSYAVNFRFTLKDTIVLAKLLSEVGFNFIEIGHGLGINASRAGKGEMPASDEEILFQAKSVAGNAKLGMFCIPGIASVKDLEKMSKLGLDFVRIGSNAGEIENAYPYIETAVKHGVFTFVNFMKTYAIPHQDFGRHSKLIHKLGADVIYIVDSAGCMYPGEIDDYIKELKAINIKSGFHGHDNLNYAVANTIEAIRNGVDFVDTTMYGIGRDAGNAPTEVILAILETMNINTGVDIFEFMNIAERYLGPLKNQLPSRDMISVAMGLGRFHSSFLPHLKDVAKNYNVDLKKLIVTMGRRNPSSINEKELISAAKQLEGDSKEIDENIHDIISFSASKIGKDYISNTLDSVEDLIEGLLTASAKTRKKVAIELVPSNEHDEEFILAEYLTSDEDMVIGRIYFGSFKVLESILGLIKSRIPLVVVDRDRTAAWVDIQNIYSFLERHIEREKVTVYSSRELCNFYLLENILFYKYGHNSKNLLICGTGNQSAELSSKISDWFDNILIYETQTNNIDKLHYPNKCSVLKMPIDWKQLNLEVDLILCLSFLSTRELDNILQGASKNLGFIFINEAIKEQIKDKSNFKNFHPVYVDPAFAYHGQFKKWMTNKKNLIYG